MLIDRLYGIGISRQFGLRSQQFGWSCATAAANVEQIEGARDGVVADVAAANFAGLAGVLRWDAAR